MYYMTSQHIMEMKSILKDDKKLEEAFNRRAGVDKVQRGRLQAFAQARACRPAWARGAGEGRSRG